MEFETRYLKVHTNAIWIGNILDGDKTYGIPLRTYLSTYSGYLLFEEKIPRNNGKSTIARFYDSTRYQRTITKGFAKELITGEQAIIATRDMIDVAGSVDKKYSKPKMPNISSIDGTFKISLYCDIHNPNGVSNFSGTLIKDVERDWSESVYLSDGEIVGFYNTKNIELIATDIRAAIRLGEIDVDKQRESILKQSKSYSDTKVKNYIDSIKR